MLSFRRRIPGRSHGIPVSIPPRDETEPAVRRPLPPGGSPVPPGEPAAPPGRRRAEPERPQPLVRGRQHAENPLRWERTHGKYLELSQSVNKKVLLCERKRHTARRVASDRCAVLSTDGGTPIQSPQGVPPSSPDGVYPNQSQWRGYPHPV